MNFSYNKNDIHSNHFNFDTHVEMMSLKHIRFSSNSLLLLITIQNDNIISGTKNVILYFYYHSECQRLLCSNSNHNIILCNINIFKSPHEIHVKKS